MSKRDVCVAFRETIWPCTTRIINVKLIIIIIIITIIIIIIKDKRSLSVIFVDLGRKS